MADTGSSALNQVWLPSTTDYRLLLSDHPPTVYVYTVCL